MEYKNRPFILMPVVFVQLVGLLIGFFLISIYSLFYAYSRLSSGDGIFLFFGIIMILQGISCLLTLFFAYEIWEGD